MIHVFGACSPAFKRGVRAGDRVFTNPTLGGTCHDIIMVSTWYTMTGCYLDPQSTQPDDALEPTHMVVWSAILRTLEVQVGLKGSLKETYLVPIWQ